MVKRNISFKIWNGWYILVDWNMVESKAYSSVGALIGATVGGIVGLVLAMKYQFGTDNLYILPLIIFLSTC